MGCGLRRRPWDATAAVDHGPVTVLTSARLMRSRSSFFRTASRSKVRSTPAQQSSSEPSSRPEPHIRSLSGPYSSHAEVSIGMDASADSWRLREAHRHTRSCVWHHRSGEVSTILTGHILDWTSGRGKETTTPHRLMRPSLRQPITGRPVTRSPLRLHTLPRCRRLPAPLDPLR